MAQKKLICFLLRVVSILLFVFFINPIFCQAEIEPDDIVDIESNLGVKLSSDGSQTIESDSSYSRPDGSVRRVEQKSVTLSDGTTYDVQVVTFQDADGNIIGEGYVNLYDAEGNLISQYRIESFDKEKSPAEEDREELPYIPPPELSAKKPARQKSDVFIKSWWQEKGKISYSSGFYSETAYTVKVYQEYEGNFFSNFIHHPGADPGIFIAFSQELPQVLQVEGHTSIKTAEATFSDAIIALDMPKEEKEMLLSNTSFQLAGHWTKKRLDQWFTIVANPVRAYLQTDAGTSPTDFNMSTPIPDLNAIADSTAPTSIHINDILQGNKVKRAWTVFGETHPGYSDKRDCELEFQILLSPSAKKRLRRFIKK